MALMGVKKEYRGILTQHGLEILPSGFGISENYYYRVVPWAQEKVGQLEKDRVILDQYDKELANEFREDICKGEDNQ
jgi:hypothetical protein